MTFIIVQALTCLRDSLLLHIHQLKPRRTAGGLTAKYTRFAFPFSLFDPAQHYFLETIRRRPNGDFTHRRNAHSIPEAGRLASPASSSPSHAHEHLLSFRRSHPHAQPRHLPKASLPPPRIRTPTIRYGRYHHRPPVSAISTVKVFNRETHGHPHADAAFYRFNEAAGEISAVWGITSYIY